MSRLGVQLRQARKDAGLTQTRLARKTGVSTTTISDIERGRNESSKDLFKLARVLEVSVEWLMTGTDNPDTPSAETQIVQNFAEAYRLGSDEDRAYLRGVVDTIRRKIQSVPRG